MYLGAADATTSGSLYLLYTAGAGLDDWAATTRKKSARKLLQRRTIIWRDNLHIVKMLASRMGRPNVHACDGRRRERDEPAREGSRHGNGQGENEQAGMIDTCSAQGWTRLGRP